jgi:hypothetical protein
MAVVRAQRWFIPLALGAIGGVLLCGVWPSAPLHAVATDHAENFALATGFVAEGLEAVFLLDFQTGTLRGSVISCMAPGFQASYQVNVLGDLSTAVTEINSRIGKENVLRKKQGGPPRPAIEVPQSPHFMLVTGMGDIRRGGGQAQPGRSLVYVAEKNTGVVLAYALQWLPQYHNTDRPYNGKLVLWAADQFAGTVIRAE